MSVTLTPAMLEQLRLQAAAESVRRHRAGQWKGGCVPHEEYQQRPLDWIVDKLEIPRETLVWKLAGSEYETHSWDGTEEPLVRILEEVAAGNDVGVESATGTGKSFLMACLILWFLACFRDSLTVTVAPKEDQLLKNIWKEVGGLWKKFHAHFPDAVMLTGLIRMRPAEEDKEKWSAFAFVCGVGADEESATKAQGFHARDMLIITEETPGIHRAIMNSLFNTRTADHNIQVSVGNPDHRHDELHRFCEQDGVVPVRISALDHPNMVTGREVVPGTFGRKRMLQRIAHLGVGSRLYQSRIRGISPAEAEDALIQWDWCVEAAKKWADPAYRVGLPALGVDVAASENGDKGAISRWEGACCTEVVASPCPDPNVLGADVAAEARERGILGKHIGVDSVGVGAGTVGEGKRQGFKFKEISGGKKAIPGLDVDTLWSESAEDENGKLKPKGPTLIEIERYDNMRSQVWYRLREDLRNGRIALPFDEELFRDLTTPTYRTLNGKIIVESKESMWERLRRSPNKGDAVAYGNWVRHRVPLPKPADAPNHAPGMVDTGLEKIIARRNKQQRSQERQMMRLMMQRARGRKR